MRWTKSATRRAWGSLGGMIAFLLAAACNSGRTEVFRLPKLVLGTWGGEGIRLMADSGGGTVRLTCGEGSIDRPIVPDEQGSFTVEGTYIQTGGPGPAWGSPCPAFYRGSVSARAMALTVTVGDTGQFTLGPFLLMAGDPGHIGFCALV